MKNKLFMIVGFFACLSCGDDGKLQGKEHTIDKPYKYELYESKIAQFKTGEERHIASMIPEEILNKMTTEALIESVLNYPLIVELALYNSFEEGFIELQKHFNGIDELLSRPDAARKLIEKYKRLDATKVASMNAEENNSLKFALVEMLLSQSQLLEVLDIEEKKGLVLASLGQFKIKKQNGAGYLGLAICGAVMKKTMETSSFFLSSKSKLFVQGSYGGVDKENIDAIISDAENFIKQ